MKSQKIIDTLLTAEIILAVIALQHFIARTAVRREVAVRAPNIVITAPSYACVISGVTVDTVVPVVTDEGATIRAASDRVSGRCR